MCPVCRYSLEGLKNDRCPECGAELVLGVHSPSLRLGPWVFAVVATAMPGGFCAFMSIFAVLSLLDGQMPRNQLIHMIAVIVLAVIYASILVALVRLRRRWLMMSYTRQRVLSCVIFVMTVSSTGLWMSVVFR